ncbi:hypothetical protein FOA43_000224 [Brettanomyces nanus]|uniref:Biogenesis of lysosome-related organelles complex 1 subunit KXD1 n=1 Tax=Eeniella nana TaxID=13502 RepID=A0A875RMY7_EENNA|nr:uncharacterized protein FOA43_000224 [Brettanomyces nanus]QPG72920.1 hypothetical protein FOA43_000224 [Brettanomyces nanus]
MPSEFARQSNPSIDGFQFMVQSDTESSIDTSAGTSYTSNDEDENPNPLEERAHHSDNEAGGMIPSASRFNAVDYLINSLYNSLDSVELDQSLVQQSQISGEMNNTANEISKTIKELKQSLQEHIEKYEKLKKRIIPEIIANLNQSSKISKKLAVKMKTQYPVEYSKSKDKVLNRLTDEEQDLYI